MFCRHSPTKPRTLALERFWLYERIKYYIWVVCAQVYILWARYHLQGLWGALYKLQLVSHYLNAFLAPLSNLSLDGRQQVMACTLLCTDLPPDQRFLQFVYSAQCACWGSPHPNAGDAAAARWAARGNVFTSTGLTQPPGFMSGDNKGLLF